MPRGQRAHLDSDMCARIDPSSCLVEPSCSLSCFTHVWHRSFCCRSRLSLVSLLFVCALWWTGSVGIHRASRCSLCSFSIFQPHLHLKNIHGFHNLGILYLLHRWYLSVRIDRDIFYSCCSSTVSKPLECCAIGFASHLIDLLLDDRILSLHGVLDDLGLFHLHCVDVVLGVHVRNLLNGSLLDPVLRYTVFDWSLRGRDFRNSDDMPLLSTESEESRPV